MKHEFDEMPDDPTGRDAAEGLGIDELSIPHRLACLDDGKEVLIIGDVEGYEVLGHKQGNNELGFRGDCGLVSCEVILNGFGAQVTENDVVRYAVDHGLCAVDSCLDRAGGTTLQDQADVLAGFGVPAHCEHGRSLEDLAGYIEEGRGVIAEVDSSALWDEPSYTLGQVDHAITVTGVARDPVTGSIAGFFVNDSGAGHSGMFVDRDKMESMFNGSLFGGPGLCVVTDLTIA